MGDGWVEPPQAAVVWFFLLCRFVPPAGKLTNNRTGGRVVEALLTLSVLHGG